MEKHFFFISLRKTLFLTATFVLLIGNTQPSYAMLGVDEELQDYAERHSQGIESSTQTEKR